MGFTSILKKLEEGAIKTGAVIAQIEGFEPIAKLLIPQTKAVVAAEAKADLAFSHLDHLVQMVQVAGTANGMTNDQKVQAEAALFTQLLIAGGHMSGHDVADTEAVKSGIEQIVKGWVTFKNGLKA